MQKPESDLYNVVEDVSRHLLSRRCGGPTDRLAGPTGSLHCRLVGGSSGPRSQFVRGPVADAARDGGLVVLEYHQAVSSILGEYRPHLPPPGR